MGDYNVTVADFAGKNRICMTDTLYQYDYGQKLQIDNIPALPQTYEAHFSNVQHGGASITVTGMDGIVDIPNALLMTGKRIYCWIYVTEPGSGETEYQVLMPVQARPMPEYYDVTDTGAFDSVVQQVGEYAATATAGATNATASAAAAATSASEAAASASAAETAKNAAETAQAAAETAAQTATDKASQTAQDAAQAAQSKADAESAAQRAEAAQTGAESAKTDAETAAQGAADSASAASASATSAGQAATSAGQSASAAAGSATTAGNAAQTATTKAGEAFASADAAAASETAAQTAQTAAETAAANAGQSASTATTKAEEAAQSASNAAASETAAEAAATRAETAAASLVVDDALSETSENPVQNKVVTESVTQLKNAFQASLDGIDIFSNYTSFKACGLFRGNNVYSEKYRASSQSVISLDRDINVRIADGYRIRLNIFIDNAFSSETSWYVGTYPIKSGTAFKIVIAKTKETEDVTSTADVLTFVNAVTFETVQGFELAKHESGWDNLFSGAGIPIKYIGRYMRGNLDNGAVIAASTYRVISTDILYTERDITTWVSNNAFRYAVNIYDANGVLIDDSGWVTRSFVIPARSYYRFLVARITENEQERADVDLFTSAVLMDSYVSSFVSKDRLPDYWQIYMDENLPAIVSQVAESAMTGDSFVFFTDYHIEYNSGRSHLLMRQIVDNTPIKKIVFGGDVLNGSATKAQTHQKYQEFAQRFRHLPVFGIRGNHEYNLNDGGSESVKFTDNEIYNYLVKPCEDKITSTGKMYYYVDNNPQKIRYIFLDSRNISGYEDYPMDQEQLTWLSTVLSGMSSDWSVIIFVHAFMAKLVSDGTWYVSANGELIEGAIEASNTQATIVAIISGHFHEDYSMMKNGIAYIVTTWDGYYADQNRTLYTTTELAFDVFTVDTSAKTIKAKRIGYGNDRQWTYGQA